MTSLYAYTAGLFDGEGHITLSRNKGYGGSLRVGITNTDISSLYNLRQEWGNIGTISVRKSKTNWKPRADWRMGGEVARDFLTKLLPYLKIKLQRAEIVLGVTYAKIGSNYSPEDRIALSAAVDKLAEMNKRGLDICQS